MIKIVSLFIAIAFFEVLLYIIFFHKGIFDYGLISISVYKEYFNEYLVLSLLYIVFFKRNKIIDILLYLLLGFVLLVDVVQFLSYYYTNAFITIDALDNISQILLFLNNLTIIITLLFLIVYLSIINYLNKKRDINNRVKAFLIFLIFLLTNFTLYYENKHKNEIFDEFSIEKGPLLNFSRVIIKYFEPLNIKYVDLNKKEKLFIKKYKIMNNVNVEYPFLKNKFYQQQLKNNNITKKPNVIVFFVESLSAHYVDLYNTKEKNITINIDNLGKKGFFVTNYINHSFPTIRGIYGQLCSLYPEFRVRDIVDHYNTYHFYNKKCLPSYLNEYDYHTVYLNHGNKKRQEIGRLSKSYGFQETLFNKDIEQLIKEKPKHALDDDMSDQQMANSVIHYLKKYNNKQPLFMAVSTIETHAGEQLSDDVVTNKNLNNIENTYYNLDNALGKIFKYINHSKYLKNTIIIVTGDHVRMENYKKYHSKIYGNLALIIYSPFFKHKSFKANTSSIDLAPTILHLINYPNKKNAFQGKSIFEDNNNLAIGVTKDYGMFYSLFDKNGTIISSEQFSNPNNKYSKYIYDILNYTFMIYSKNRLYK